MGFWDTVGKGAKIAQEKMAEQSEKMNKAMDEATKWDDRTLVRRWYNCHDSMKKAGYATEIKNRGLSSDEIKSYL